MKLDKYTFARLIAFIGNTYAVTVHADTMQEIDDIVNIPEPEPLPAARANPAEVDELLYLMVDSTRKIEAIKAYRTLTGASLKDAKESVERYWIDKTTSTATLSDIIGNY